MKPNVPLRIYNRILRPILRIIHVGELSKASTALSSTSTENPVVVVLMSGSLHVAWLALAHIPENRHVLLVFNGLDRWETAWAAGNLRATHRIRFSAVQSHSYIINLLIERLRSNFYLLDYDCFVLNPEWFARLANLEDDHMMGGCFPFSVAGLGIELAHTFLLFVNRKLLLELKSRFGVGAEELTWDRLSEPVRASIRRTGLSDGVYPEIDRPYFDTLRALALLGIGEGKRCLIEGRFAGDPVPSKEMVHIGGVSPRAGIFNFWLYRGAYFWCKALQSVPDRSLGQHYRNKFGNSDPAQLAAAFPQFAGALGKDVDELFDEIIRVSSASQAR